VGDVLVRGHRPITLSQPQVDGGRVAVRIEPGSARKYLRPGWLLVDYGDLDVSEVDLSILVIPALGTVLPIAYASGAAVVVDAVDRAYAEAAQELAPLWQELYPRFSRRGLVLEGARVDNQVAPTGGSMLLFSGGLDSTTTLIAREAEITSLLTVWGADIPVDDRQLWMALDDHLEANILAAGRRRVRARTNFRLPPVEETLVHDFLGAGASWWSHVQHGMALIGVAAPVTIVLGVGRLLVASSGSPQFNQLNGSMPHLDVVNRWAGVSVDHDGFELARQGKITQRLAPFVASRSPVPLAVCYQPRRGAPGAGLNCGRCEKCLRTAAGFLTAGLDPGGLGLRVDEATYDHWATLLTGRDPVLSPRMIPAWRLIAAAMGAESESGDGATDSQRRFIEAIRYCDFSAIERTDSHRGRARKEAKYRVRRVVPGTALGPLIRLSGGLRWRRTANLRPGKSVQNA
jgi:hypothetical protein